MATATTAKATSEKTSTSKKKGSARRSTNGNRTRKSASLAASKPLTGAAADKAAEEAMNKTAEEQTESSEITNVKDAAKEATTSADAKATTVVPLEGESQQGDGLQDADSSDDANDSDQDDDIIKLPENEYAFLSEILKNPTGDPNEHMYEISKDAPKAAFKGRGSPKTLAQTAKNKLIQRGIIKSVKKGGAQSRAIVQLLIENVEMSTEGRGRKVNTRPTVSARRGPGRPKGSTTTNRAPRQEAAANEARRPGRQTTLNSVLAELRGADYEDPNEFEAELKKFSARFPNTFSRFVKVLRRQNAA